ncbi:MAG: CRISPR-associated endonuclease Cas2 [Candidatus Aenigmarchaeota archaeon]|nr:CRISPR-associated endonuclease Cas2 [Candidatus Aenigmarchaeota archaeon]
MLYWVIYDITNNSLRSKVSKKCKNYGLKRVQKSAFLGETSKNKIEMLALEIEEVLKESDDNVYVLPSCDSCFGGKIIRGNLDEESVIKKDFYITGD